MPLAFKLNRKLFYVLKLINHLSIDVVVGGVASYYFFCTFFQVNASVITASLLGMAIWCIYTLDHLIDARQLKDTTADSRHTFHHKYFTELTLLVAGVIVTALAILPKLDMATLLAGVKVAGWVVLYFISIHLLPWKRMAHKEFTIGMLYTTGILVGPLSLYQGDFKSVHYVMIAAFQLVVWYNLIAFSLRDVSHDEQHGFSSLATALGQLVTKRMLSVLEVIIATSALALLLYNRGDLMLLVVLMQLTIRLATRHVDEPLYFRIVADAVFVLPTVFV